MVSVTGLIATSAGLFPTGMVAITGRRLFRVLITDTVLSVELATYKRLAGALSATPQGPWPTGMGVSVPGPAAAPAAAGTAIARARPAVAAKANRTVRRSRADGTEQ